MSDNFQLTNEKRIDFFITDNCIFDYKLDGNSFMVYSLLQKMSRDNECFPSISHICNVLDLSNKTVIKCINILEQKQLISITRFEKEKYYDENGVVVYKQQNNIYKLKDLSNKKECGKSFLTASVNFSESPCNNFPKVVKNLHSNNTTLNNTNSTREKEQEKVITQTESEPSKPSSNNSLFLDFEINMLKAYSTLTALTHISSYDDLWKHDIPEKHLKRQKEREMLENAVKNNLDLDITAIMRKVLVYAKNNTKDSNLRWYTFKSQLLISISEASEQNIALQNANQSQINQARQRENEEALREEENKKWYETYTTMFDITESELDRLSRMKFDDVCIGAFVLSGEDDEAMHNDLVRYITENKHRLSQIDTEPSKSDTDSNYTSDVENSAINQNVSMSDVVNNMNYKNNYNKPNANKLLKQFGISDDTISK